MSSSSSSSSSRSQPSNSDSHQPNDRSKILSSLKTSDSSFDPIGQYYLDPAKHRKQKTIKADPISSNGLGASKHEIALRTKVRQLSCDDASLPAIFFLTWISPLVSLGKRYNLVAEDVPAIPSRCKVSQTYPRFISWWQWGIQREQKKIMMKYEHQAKEKYPQFLRNQIGDISQLTPIPPNLDVMNTIPPQLIDNHPAVKVLSTNGFNKGSSSSNSKKKDGAQYTNLDSSPSTPLKSIKQLEQSVLDERETYPWLFPLLYLTQLTPYFFTVLGDVLYYVFMLTQPYTIKRLSKYFAAHQLDPESSTFSEGASWALLLSLLTILASLTQLLKNQSQVDISARQCAALLATIFEKTYKLSSWALSDDPHLSTGSLTNMVNQDMTKVFFTPIFINFPWSGTLCILACVLLMYKDLGNAAWVCAAMMLLLLPYQFLLARMIAKKRREVLLLSDKRIKFVTECLGGLRVLKAYAWQPALAQQIEVLRNEELQTQMVVNGLNWINEIVAYSFPLFVMFATIAFYVRFGEDLTPETVFLIITYLNTIKFPIQYLSLAITAIIDFSVSSTRMARLFAKAERPLMEAQVRELMKEYNESLSKAVGYNTAAGPNGSDDGTNLDSLGSPVDPFAIPIDYSSNTTQPIDNNTPVEDPNAPLVKLNHVDFYWASWDKRPNQLPVLADVNMELYAGEIITVIGGSASGKTALLSGILGNLYPQPHKTFDGLQSIQNIHQEIIPGQYSFANCTEIIPSSLMTRSLSCGYAAQSPFLMNNTLRNNIILSSPFDQDKFQQVIEAAALGPDLAILPNADLSIISDSGLSLSGGQQARVAFARVLYHADVIKVAVLDDIFAAVDAMVAHTMFFKGVMGMLKNCGVILALNSHYDFLNHSTRTIYLAPSPDPFWWALQTGISSRRDEYHEQYEERCIALGLPLEENDKVDSSNSNKTSTTSTPGLTTMSRANTANKQSLPPLQQNLFSPTTTTIAGSPVNTTTTALNQPPQSPNDPRSPDPFKGPSLSRQSSSRNDTTGFRQPSFVLYCGDTEGLMQLETALIQSITLAKHSSSSDEENDDNTVTIDLEDNNNVTSTNISKKFLEKLKREEDNNTKLSKTAGLVNDKKTLDEINKKLSQKVEGHDEKKDSQAVTTSSSNQTASSSPTTPPPAASSGAPTQARLPGRVYLEYFKGGNSDFVMYVTVITILVVAIATQVFRTVIDLWMLEWAEDVTVALAKDLPQVHSNSYWVWSSIFILVVASILGVLQVFLFLFVALSASKTLHRKTIYHIFHATIGYLDTTPAGTLINALTRDILTIDQQLSACLISILQQVLALFAIVLLSVWTSPLLLLPLIPTVLLIMWFRTGYHNTSIQLRRIENAASQPVHTAFNSLLKGAAVIKAFPDSIQNADILKFRNLIDTFQRSVVVNILAERRFAFALNMLTAVYIVFLTFLVVALRHHLDTTLGLLAITYSLKLTGSLQITIRVITTATQAMTSVHRLQLLQANIPQEPSFSSDEIAKEYIKKFQPPEFEEYQLNEHKNHLETTANEPRYIMMDDNKTMIDLHHKHNQQQELSYFPWRGKIEFNNLTLRYRPNLPVVLNKLNLTIQPGQHVGVCGKTGAGKSTILLSLLRFINFDSGSVNIDGVDIMQLGLGDLRGTLGLIPQSPTIFSGTIRTNLDPLSRFTDEAIWASLRLVDMIEKIEQLPNGLYSAVLENGSNFSSSERQLLCIARSLLKTDYQDLDANGENNNKNKKQNKYTTPHQGSILLADEITSSVSADSDALVQSTIRKAFSQSTILVIAHRLASVVDLDRILVLRPMTEALVAAGESSLLEFEVPFILLNNPESQFFSMCMATGADNFVLLWCKARDSFFQTQKKELQLYNNYIQTPKIDYDNLPLELVNYLESERKGGGASGLNLNTSTIFSPTVSNYEPV